MPNVIKIMKDKIKNMSAILHTTCKLSTPKDEAMKMLRRDARLVYSMDTIVKQLESEGVEIFERTANLCIASNGYHFALYETDLVSVDGL